MHIHTLRSSLSCLTYFTKKTNLLRDILSCLNQCHTICIVKCSNQGDFICCFKNPARKRITRCNNVYVTFDPSVGGSNPKQPRFKQQISHHYSSIGFQFQLLWLPSLERDLEGLEARRLGDITLPTRSTGGPGWLPLSSLSLAVSDETMQQWFLNMRAEWACAVGGAGSGRREPIAIGLRKLTQDKKGLFTPDRQGQGGRQASCHRLAERSAHCFHHRSLIKLTIQYANSGTIH